MLSITYLVCPQCKGQLHYHPQKQELICRLDRLAYPIVNDIPVMLITEARVLTVDEAKKI